MQAPLQSRNDSDAVQTKTGRTAKQERSLVDNRPAAVAQRKLAEMMNNAPRVLQRRALRDAIQNSPRIVALRDKTNALFGGAVQRQADRAMPAGLSPAQPQEKPNNTGLPNQLKAGIESLSGMSMDHVKVHYNSPKPAQLQAHAYTQGSEIHVGPGQQKYLPHEAWHVVQQAQGRVQPSIQMKSGIGINVQPALEHEADVMGARAAAHGSRMNGNEARKPSAFSAPRTTIQCVLMDGGKTYTSKSPDEARAAATALKRRYPGLEQKTIVESILAKSTFSIVGRRGQYQIKEDITPDVGVDRIAPIEPSGHASSSSSLLSVPSPQANLRSASSAAASSSFYQRNIPDQPALQSPSADSEYDSDDARSPASQVVRYTSASSGPALASPEPASSSSSMQPLPFRGMDPASASSATAWPPYHSRGKQEAASPWLNDDEDYNSDDANEHHMRAPSYPSASSDPAHMSLPIPDDVPGAVMSGGENEEKESAPARSGQHQDSRPGTWGEYEEGSATPDDTQRFGIEIELKEALIPYGEEGGVFKTFAVQHGHKAFANRNGLELHLDHGSSGFAILEIVLSPGLSAKEFMGKLIAIKSMLNQKADGAWLNGHFTLTAPEDIKNYIINNITGTTSIRGNPVQITTTHTAKELKNVIGQTNEQYMTVPDRGAYSSIDLRKSKEMLTDEFIVNRYLANAPTPKSKTIPGKGSNAMIKHAAEQFELYQGKKPKPGTTVDRIHPHTKELNELHTHANKPAPVFKRKNKTAYVVEYRTSSDLTHTAANYLAGKTKATELESLLKKYQG